MHLWTFILLLAFSLVSDSRHVVFEETHLPKGWTAVGMPAPRQRISLSVALRPPQSHVQLFEQTLSAISNPYHAQYGQHLRRHELKDLVRATEAAQAVTNWLTTSGIDRSVIKSDEEWIKFSTTIVQAEVLLNATFRIYHSPTGDHTIIRTLRFSVPEDITDQIELVHPMTRFPRVRPAHDDILRVTNVSSSAMTINSSCSESITPSCLRQLYNINSYNLSTDRSCTGFMGVSGYLKQYARYADIVAFLQKYSPAATGTNFTWTSINGGLLSQNDPNDSGEANLDMEYTVSLTNPLPINFYSTGGLGELIPDNDEPTQADNSNEPYLDQLNYLINLPDGQLPHALTTSYGEDEQSVPASYAQKVCNMFGALGLRGVSVIFSSGDAGVGSACETNDGTNRTRFNTQFPASCPYVTAVGATMGIEPEVAAPFSGGGFSERWPRPWWQQNAMVNYLENLGNEKWAGLYNPWGRGLPDVAAQGSNFAAVDKGSTFLISGTSCSAPTFASIIGLINALKVESGQPPLGFLNPWLYTQAASALNDITQGGSTGCTGFDSSSGLRTPFVPHASWNATEGWDPVTGLGTPDFQKLLKVAMAPAYRMHRRSRL